MKTLDRYIAKSVFAAVLIVQMLLLGLDMMLALVNELDNLNDSYQLSNALYYVMLSAPRRFYDLVPVGVMVGALIGLGSLASNNELAVIRAAGVSITRIIWSVMKPMLLIIMVTAFVGEFISPKTEVEAQNYRTMKRWDTTNAAGKSGVWLRDGNDYFYFRSIRTDGKLSGIQRHSFDEAGKKLLSITYAQSGHYDFDKKGWVLDQAVKANIGTHRVVNEQIPSIFWSSDLKPELMKVIILEQRYLAPSDLWRYSQYLKDQGLKSHEHEMAFWQKVLLPLTLSSLVLVAASFVFGPLRSAPAGTRVFSGVIVGLAVKYVQDILGPASVVYGFDPVWAVLTPTIGCALYGVFLIRRTG
ncbi:LPS export ABC transporter permease LptG [Oceanospirillum sp.]|uniref:LPS export ABC transporter permease LptG n=1 Tax=Oceanospirillum sp. TaxID=2021254 RepID=UPI003A932BC9